MRAYLKMLIFAGLAVAAWAVLTPTWVRAAGEVDWSLFEAHDPTSTISIDHAPYDKALRRSVLPVGKTKRRISKGAIGGPSLPNRAFTRANVDEILRRSANEFVNSNRGIRNWGGKFQVSLVYGWSEALFPNWDQDLKVHLMTHADPALVARLGTAERFEAKIYDWVIADLMGGDLKRGNASLNSAALLGTDLESSYYLALTQGLSTNVLPPHVIEILRGITRNTERPGRPQVEVQECGEGDCR